jgi:tRNA(fMet)-specific endonuclease VapC
VKYFLDTNICVYYLKGMYSELARTLLAHHPDQIRIPSIVKAELLHGAYRSKKMEENLRKIHAFLLPFRVIPFGDAETDRYATIRAELEHAGQVLGPNDLIVAAIAAENEGVLITNNEREFRRVRDLRVENWTG